VITVDIGLRASAKYGATTSVVMTLEGALGTTHGGALTSMDITMEGTLTGGLDVMFGMVSIDVSLPAAQWNKVWTAESLTRGVLGIDSYEASAVAWLLHDLSMVMVDNEELPPVTVYSLSVDPTVAIRMSTQPLYVPPAPPAAPPDAPPEHPEEFPMPVYGGILLRALHGVVVDMDPPTIEDGIPHS